MAEKVYGRKNQLMRGDDQRKLIFLTSKQQFSANKTDTRNYSVFFNG